MKKMPIKLNVRAIVLGKMLQDSMSDAVWCRLCQGHVEIIENVSSRNGLGSSWTIRCQNENCPSENTNSAFRKMEKRKGFKVNQAIVLSLQTTGCDHAGASKFLSFLGQSKKRPSTYLRR